MNVSPLSGMKSADEPDECVGPSDDDVVVRVSGNIRINDVLEVVRRGPRHPSNSYHPINTTNLPPESIKI